MVQFVKYICTFFLMFVDCHFIIILYDLYVMLLQSLISLLFHACKK